MKDSSCDYSSNFDFDFDSDSDSDSIPFPFPFLFLFLILCSLRSLVRPKSQRGSPEPRAIFFHQGWLFSFSRRNAYFVDEWGECGESHPHPISSQLHDIPSGVWRRTKSTDGWIDESTSQWIDEWIKRNGKFRISFFVSFVGFFVGWLICHVIYIPYMWLKYSIFSNTRQDNTIQYNI